MLGQMHGYLYAQSFHHVLPLPPFIPHSITVRHFVALHYITSHLLSPPSSLLSPSSNMTIFRLLSRLHLPSSPVFIFPRQLHHPAFLLRVDEPRLQMDVWILPPRPGLTHGHGAPVTPPLARDVLQVSVLEERRVGEEWDGGALSHCG